MNAIEELLARKSHNRLTEPAPTPEQLDIMLRAAVRAPDHAQLRPWQFRIYAGESLMQLGEFFAIASQFEDPDVSDSKVERIKNKPLRAPMVIVASVTITEHPKVPEVEQILSAGASVQNLLIAAHFLGIGAIWRTGGLAFNRELMNLLEMPKNESIVGFIYLGKEEGSKRPVPQINLKEHVRWL